MIWGGTGLLNYVMATFLLLLLGATLYDDIKVPYEGYPQWAIFAFGWLMPLAIFLISFLFAHFSREETNQEM